MSFSNIIGDNNDENTSSSSSSTTSSSPSSTGSGDINKYNNGSGGFDPSDLHPTPTDEDGACGFSYTKVSNTITPNDPNSWVMAPIFIPQSKKLTTATAPNNDNIYKTYVDVANGNSGEFNINNLLLKTANGSNVRTTLCPYFKLSDKCIYGDRCDYNHCELCEFCGKYCLHPRDNEQKQRHLNQCIKQHEKDMELSFAIARSKDKLCGICFEVIMEKSGRDQRFGILPNCNHVFCLECIRKWRQAKQFENKIIRSCPECRVTSDFVCPSIYWVDTKEEKEKLINDYKTALNAKDCKYFKKGQGKCPFGNKCFYKHALPNGVIVDVGVPQRRVRRHNNFSEVDFFRHLFFLNYLDTLDMDSVFSDSDLSNISETEYYFEIN